MDYYDHEAAACHEYKMHWMNCMHQSEEYREDPWSNDDLRLDMDMIREDVQIKFLDDGNIKIKWEFPCQWCDCKWQLYYCKIIREPFFENYINVYGVQKIYQEEMN